MSTLPLPRRVASLLVRFTDGFSRPPGIRIQRGLLAAALFLAFHWAGHAASFDVLILNGRVLDGTGTPWIYTDIGIRGDRIVAVGKLATASAPHVIDATGLYVAPGFIDPHSHAGPALARPATAAAEAILRQGITTVMINPDGGGPTDLLTQRRAIAHLVPGVNVIQFIGHNAVRTAVLGLENRAPSEDELAQMSALVRQGMEAGAFGLSAGPFYRPGNFSQTPEHVALARVAAEFDGVYTSHIRDESNYTIGLAAAVDELIQVAREARLPGIITHFKALGPGVWGLTGALVERIEQARAEGIEVFADQYPYEASSTSLAAALIPAWAQAGGTGALQARLDNPETRAQIRREVVTNLERRAGAENILIRSYPTNRTVEGKRLSALAQETLSDPVDTALELIRHGAASIISFNMQETDIRTLMVQPWMMTSSDGELVAFGEGIPHPRAYGAFSRKLRRYVVEGGVITLERAIHSMTGLTATVFRVRDRGFIRAGAYADLVVFDLAAVRDRSTYTDPHRYSEGVRHILINGRSALAEGRLLDSRHGRVLSRAHP